MKPPLGDRFYDTLLTIETGGVGHLVVHGEADLTSTQKLSTQVNRHIAPDDDGVSDTGRTENEEIATTALGKQIVSLSTPGDIRSINFPSVDYSDYCVKTKLSRLRISPSGTEYGESDENSPKSPSQQHLRSADRSMQNDDSIVSTGSQEMSM
jgi:hypothetical protein